MEYAYFANFCFYIYRNSYIFKKLTNRTNNTKYWIQIYIEMNITT